MSHWSSSPVSVALLSQGLLNFLSQNFVHRSLYNSQINIIIFKVRVDCVFLKQIVVKKKRHHFGQEWEFMAIISVKVGNSSLKSAWTTKRIQGEPRLNSKAIS